MMATKSYLCMGVKNYYTSPPNTYPDTATDWQNWKILALSLSLRAPCKRVSIEQAGRPAGRSAGIAVTGEILGRPSSSRFQSTILMVSSDTIVEEVGTILALGSHLAIKTYTHVFDHFGVGKKEAEGVALEDVTAYGKGRNEVLQSMRINMDNPWRGTRAALLTALLATPVLLPTAATCAHLVVLSVAG
ncbi:hypothetical protein BC939DRAFT_472712 [Gamsiella multidivaricata]|uniref:uncharacterized protein n=1 Tax=Gamsiella multidivaricata TaxID=101098 RepID=UPI00221F50A4|nr:uncharacterized protein BC939DRAFT_472712 [Gamsiella multidivaricata]KAI7832498.1 hypothetical protein BC939DRAFT_472712 [Gamsiella multidivaricata]